MYCTASVTQYAVVYSDMVLYTEGLCSEVLSEVSKVLKWRNEMMVMFVSYITMFFLFRGFS